MQGRIAALLIALCAWPPLATGQDQPPVLKLHVDTETPVSCIHLDSSVWRDYPARNDFYVREAFDRYIAVSLKGLCRPALDIALVPSNPSFKSSDLHIVDLADRERGGVIATAVWNPDEHTQKPAVLVFNDDGTFNKLVFIDAAFFPIHVAEFSSGRGYVVAGNCDDDRIFQALVTSEGKVLKPNVLETPVETSTAQEKSGASNQSTMQAGLIQLVSGDDDAVYLYNPSKGRKVFRIRSDGTSTAIDLATSAAPQGERALPLRVFISYSNLYLQEALVSESKSNAEVTALNRFLLSVYDRSTGALDHAYINDGSFGGTPISMAPHEFHFLKANSLPNGTLSFSLIRAVP